MHSDLRMHVDAPYLGEELGELPKCGVPPCVNSHLVGEGLVFVAKCCILVVSVEFAKYPQQHWAHLLPVDWLDPVFLPLRWPSQASPEVTSSAPPSPTSSSHAPSRHSPAAVPSSTSTPPPPSSPTPKSSAIVLVSPSVAPVGIPVPLIPPPVSPVLFPFLPPPHPFPLIIISIFESLGPARNNLPLRARIVAVRSHGGGARPWCFVVCHFRTLRCFFVSRSLSVSDSYKPLGGSVRVALRCPPFLLQVCNPRGSRAKGSLAQIPRTVATLEIRSQLCRAAPSQLGCRSVPRSRMGPAHREAKKSIPKLPNCRACAHRLRRQATRVHSCWQYQRTLMHGNAAHATSRSWLLVLPLCFNSSPIFLPC